MRRQTLLNILNAVPFFPIFIPTSFRTLSSFLISSEFHYFFEISSIISFSLSVSFANMHISSAYSRSSRCLSPTHSIPQSMFSSELQWKKIQDYVEQMRWQGVPLSSSGVHTEHVHSFLIHIRQYTDHFFRFPPRFNFFVISSETQFS